MVYAHIFDIMQPMFVNGMCPGKSLKKNEFVESWKTLEFGICNSSKVLENGI